MTDTSKQQIFIRSSFQLTNKRGGSTGSLLRQKIRIGLPMSNHKFFAVFFACIVSFASGCASDGSDKQTIGAITGAIIGGVIGNQIGSGSGRTLATGAGIILGGLAGSRIGSYLDEQDRLEQAKATAEALEIEEQNEVAWQNPDTGVKGTVEVEPVKVDRQANLECRMVKQQVQLSDGRTMDEDLEFCRGPGGNWEIST